MKRVIGIRTYENELEVEFTMKLCKLEACLAQVVSGRNERYSKNILDSFH